MRPTCSNNRQINYHNFQLPPKTKCIHQANQSTRFVPQNKSRIKICALNRTVEGIDSICAVVEIKQNFRPSHTSPLIAEPHYHFSFLQPIILRHHHPYHHQCRNHHHHCRNHLTTTTSYTTPATITIIATLRPSNTSPLNFDCRTLLPFFIFFDRSFFTITSLGAEAWGNRPGPPAIYIYIYI